MVVPASPASVLAATSVGARAGAGATAAAAIAAASASTAATPVGLAQCIILPQAPTVAVM